MPRSMVKSRWIVLALFVFLPVLVYGQVADYNLPADVPQGTGGEYASNPRKDGPPPDFSPEPTVVWGGTYGFSMPRLRSVQWGLYGLDYDGVGRLKAAYFWSQAVQSYRSVDSTNPMAPETLFVDSVPGPISDSFQDFAYCRYDNSIWVHSSKLDRVYKINAANGAILREFTTPAHRYATGIAFDEREKKLYLIDRMGEGVYPCSIFVTDTLGNVLQRARLPAEIGYSYAGGRCLDMDYNNTNPNWPSLLLVYSFFSSSGYLDSCGLFELDKNNFSVIRRWNMPYYSGTTYWGNMRGVAYDPRDGNYWIGSMQNPDNTMWKIRGAYTPNQTNDAGVMTIQRPRGPVNVNQVIVPRVIVRNFSSTQKDVPVRLQILGTGYNEVRVKTLRAHYEDTVNFPAWTAAPVGKYTVKCSTELTGDVFAKNDIFYDTVWVEGRDVGCTRIIMPTGIVDSGATITPACSVFNYGTVTENYAVRMVIGAYNSTAPAVNHAPGTALYVGGYPNWLALNRGWQTVSCSTELASDGNPANDRKIDSVFVRVLDAEALSIVAPVGQVDSGATVTPRAVVQNNGNTTIDFSARFDIGTLYSNVQSVTGLAPGASRTIDFAPWTASELGVLATKCTVMLTGDMIEPNNVVTGTVEVQLLDAEALEIIAPTGALDSGATATPQARVRNNSTTTQSFNVRFTIVGTPYSDVQAVTLAPTQDTVVTFANWVAGIRGTFVTKCSTELTGDPRNYNDKVTSTITVNVTDVGASAIIAPSGTVDTSWQAVSARVTNYGTTTESFDVSFWIDSAGVVIYSDVQTVANLAGGTSVNVTFANWVGPHAEGVYGAKCSTMLATDVDAANDAVTSSFTVVAGEIDVAAVGITAPTGTIDTITPVTPTAEVRNVGTLPATFGVRFRILDRLDNEVYSDERLGITLPANTPTTLTFDNWTGYRDTGLYMARCSIMLGDANPVNDTVSGTFEVRLGPPARHDVSTERIVAPRGIVDTLPKTPQAEVRNRGDVAETFGVRFWIFDNLGTEVYRGDTSTTLAPGASITLSFPEWGGHHEPGKYYTRCSTLLADDDPANNVKRDSFTVRLRVLPRGWHQMADVPMGGKAKRVKDGGALAYAPVSDTEAYIYAFKGNNTCEFYKYNIQTNTWEAKESIPIMGISGKKKKVKKGATLTEVDGKIYATKGNNTLDWWIYEPGRTPYPWYEGTAVPTGGRNIRDGASATAVEIAGTKYVYFLKGSNTNEFYRYNTASGIWETMTPAPLGTSGKAYRSGSCITHDYNELIYCLKGSYNELFTYKVSDNTWLPQNATLPMIGSSGRKKKVKDGAGVAYDGTLLYALKGGNTQEFWSYQLDSNRWTQAEDIPIGTGKRVKGGGTLIRGDVWGQPVLWALKGNNTFEFWQYVPWYTVAATEPNSSEIAGGAAVSRPLFGLRASPNPFRTATAVSFALPEAGNISLRVYDVSGAAVMTLAQGFAPAGVHTVQLTTDRLASGVYLLKLVTDNATATAKLIVE